MTDNQKKLQSYSALQKYLLNAGVKQDALDSVNTGLDTNGNNIDYNYFSNFSNLTDDQKTLGQSYLNNYISDAQALNEKASAEASANNSARQSTAFNDYISRRMENYLGEREASLGQTGYTGTTEGNRIAIANNQINAQNTIESNKQSALQQALANYQNALTSNSATALDQYLTAKSSIDTQNETNSYASALSDVETFLSNEGVNNNNSISKENQKILQDTINGYNLSNENKTKLQNYLNANYGWTNTITSEDATSTTGGEIENLVTANNGKSIDDTSNNASRLYKFSVDGSEYSVRAERDVKTSNIESKGFYQALNDEQKQALLTMSKGNMYAFVGDNGIKYVVYKSGNQYVVFSNNAGAYQNTKDLTKAGFNKLYEKANKL